jgi:phospholipase/carboxylesterase
MAHGTADPVVVMARAEDSRNLLASLGHPVQWHTYPMPHSVHPREVADISAFLRRQLGNAAS